MSTLAQYNPKVSQGAVSYNMSNLQQLHVFQFGHSTGRLQNKTTTSTCTCISIVPIQCAKTVLLLIYLLQCFSLHNYTLLLFVKPSPDSVQMAHNLGTEPLIYFVGIRTEASHIGSTAPVGQLFVNEDFFCTTMFSVYLLLNGNKISSVIRPA